MILTPAAAFEALSNVSHISFTLNCGEIYPERLLGGVRLLVLPGKLKFDFRVAWKAQSLLNLLGREDLRAGHETPWAKSTSFSKGSCPPLVGELIQP